MKQNADFRIEYKYEKYDTYLNVSIIGMNDGNVLVTTTTPSTAIFWALVSIMRDFDGYFNREWKAWEIHPDYIDHLMNTLQNKERMASKIYAYRCYSELALMFDMKIDTVSRIIEPIALEDISEIEYSHTWNCWAILPKTSDEWVYITTKNNTPKHSPSKDNALYGKELLERAISNRADAITPDLVSAETYLYSEEISDSLHGRLMNRAGGKCEYCGVSSEEKELKKFRIDTSSIEHRYNIDNIILACWTCGKRVPKEGHSSRLNYASA